MVVSSLQEKKSWLTPGVQISICIAEVTIYPPHQFTRTGAVVSMPILTVLFPHKGQRWNECLACSHWLTAGQAQQHHASIPRNSFNGGCMQGFPYLLQMVRALDACARWCMSQSTRVTHTPYIKNLTDLVRGEVGRKHCNRYKCTNTMNREEQLPKISLHRF